MASLPVVFASPSARVYAATAAGGSKEEKGLLDWILGSLQKEDQFYETDPILKKVEGKNGGGTASGRRNSVAVPQKKKNGGFETEFDLDKEEEELMNSMQSFMASAT
uniref:Uncharacterized protein n=1 Tax=Salix viminalis TaxID=40686 RepID=A0A6N2L2J9_SALVM